MTRTATALLIAALAFFLSIHVHAATVLDLRTTAPTVDSIYVTGYEAPNDGAAGLFYWDATSTASDDSHSPICPSSKRMPAMLISRAI